MLVEYGGSRLVFPNPTDLAVVAIVSEIVYLISGGSLKRYWTLDQYRYIS